MAEQAVNFETVSGTGNAAAGTKVALLAEPTMNWDRLRSILNSRKFRGFASIIIVAVAWEFGARYFLTKSLFFVPLSAVFAEAVVLWNKGQLQHTCG